MPIENIVLQADDEPHQKAVDRANKRLEDFEKKSVKANESAAQSAEKSSERTIRVIDRTRNAQERFLRSLETKTALATAATPVDRLQVEQRLAVSRVAGDDKAIERVTAAYSRLIEAQKAADRAAADKDALAERNRLLDAAVRASQRASAASDQFEKALIKVNKAARAAELDRQNKLLEAAQRASQRAAAGAAQFETALRKTNEAARLAAEQAANTPTGLAGVMSGLGARMFSASLAADLVYSSILRAAGAIKNAIVDSTLYASRTEQLGVALHAVARANGIADSAVDTTVNRVKALGVTTQDAREAVSRLVASELDLAYATKLASAAQDLGRVSGEGTAVAYQRLIHAIVTGQPELVRQLGLNVNWEKSYQAVAKASKRTAEELSAQEKLQIRVNTTLQAAQNYQGVYAASLETSGGKLLSLKRHADEARNAIGSQFQGELKLVVDGLTAMAKGVENNGILFGEVARNALVQYTGGISILSKVYQLLKGDADSAAKSMASIQKEQIRQFNANAAANIQKKTQADAETALQKTLKDREELTKKISDAEKTAASQLRSAQLQEVTGVERILREREQLLKIYGLSAKAIRDINEATRLGVSGELRKIQKDAREAAGTDAKAFEQERQAALDFRVKQFQDSQSYERATLELHLETLDERYSAESDAIERARDMQLRELDAVNARTVQGKAAIEDRRLAIETDAINRSAILHIQEIAERQRREVEYLEVLKKIRPEAELEIQRRIDAVILSSSEQASRISSDRDAKLAAARQDRELRVQEFARAEAQRTFDEYQRGFEGLFDAAFEGARSFWDAARRMAFAIFLTPVKQGLSNMMAGALTGRGGGGFSLGGLFAGGGSSVFGGGSVVGGPGGTSGFSGPVGGAGRFGIPGIGMAGAGGLRDFIGLGSSISTGAGSATTLGAATFGQKLSSVGRSNAALLGGGLLAFDGLRRGGLTGLAETTAGGALIGFKFGGPIGAAIGAGIGATAGIIRLFVKGASEKAKEKIRAIYGVNMQDKGILGQIVETAKSAFGGNLDVAIRSPQIRDLIELYAMTTGQSVRGGFAPQMRPATLMQSGGSVSEAPSFQNGTAIPSIGSSGGGQTTVIQVVVPGAKEFFENETVEVVARNGRAVSRSVADSQQGNFNRREMATAALFPSLVTS